MNFCSECGIELNPSGNPGYCPAGHKLPTEALPALDVAVRQDRKLPTTREERVAAYSNAIKRLAEIFRRFGFFVMNESAFACTAEKGPLVIDFKTEDNTGRIAYVTSSAAYNPEKAGKNESGATIQKGRKLFTSRDLLRVTVAGKQSIPIFLELRQNIADPELHICKGVMFVLRLALDRDSALHKALRNVDFLKDVPKEWLPAPGIEQEYPELAALIEASQKPNSLPASLPRWESEPSLSGGPVLDV